jgi:hypothetical protein
MVNNENLPQSIWNMYGLKHNPFSTDPLLIEEGFIPLETFVGRAEELGTLKTLFKMGGGTRIIVTGDTGVGKTSFVNYSRWEAIKTHKFFTHLREIEVKESWTPNDFIAHTLANIYNSIERQGLLDFSKEVKKKLSYLFDIIELKEGGVSFEVLGIGAGVNSSHTINTPKITTELLRRLFNEVINELVRLGFRQIILHYNNLENLERENVIHLFIGLRDFFQNERVHFVFVGGEPFPSAIYEVDKVRSIFAYTPIELKVFTLPEINQVLKNRISVLSIPNMKVLTPYEEEVIKDLNKIHKGNIRDILNSLCIAMLGILKNNPNEPSILTKNKMREVLKNQLKETYLAKMSSVDFQVLKEILKAGETTNSDLAKILAKKRQNISKNLSKLKRIRAIKEKKLGVERIITVNPDILWINLEEAEKPNREIIEKKIDDKIQKLIDEYI